MNGKNGQTARWRERNKGRVQAAVLAAIVGGSLGLYPALEAGIDALVVACFALVAGGMAVTMWIS